MIGDNDREGEYAKFLEGYRRALVLGGWLLTGEDDTVDEPVIVDAKPGSDTTVTTGGVTKEGGDS